MGWRWGLCPSIQLSICLSIYPTVCLSVYTSMFSSLSHFVCLSVCVFLSHSFFFSFLVCVSKQNLPTRTRDMCRYTCLSVSPSVCVSVYVSLCLSSEVNKDPFHTAPSLALQPHPSSPTTPPGVRCKLIEFPFWCKCWTISIIILCVHSLTRSHSSQEAIR